MGINMNNRGRFDAHDACRHSKKQICMYREINFLCRILFEFDNNVDLIKKALTSKETKTMTKKIQQLNKLSHFGPKKCPVYLH